MGLVKQFAMPQGTAGRLVGALMAFMNAEQVRAVVREVGPVAGERVLEIGFGPGVGLALARVDAGVRVAGADPSGQMAQAAARRVRAFGDRVELRQASADQLPWPEEAFDAVCATNSAQLWQPRQESLAEVLRVLRPGGRLVLSVHERAVLPGGGSAGPAFDTELLPALREAGFTGVEGQWRPSKGARALFVSAGRSQA